MTNAKNLTEKISNKNEFSELCRELDIPTLASFPLHDTQDYYKNLRPLISNEKSYILKPVSDRLSLEDKRRRFFLCNNVAELDSCIKDECYGIGGSEAEFQIQEYMDFRNDPIIYYNTAFKISGQLTEHLTTTQLINLSAIECNMPATHWGNMHATPHFLLEKAKQYARKLAHHYAEMGYSGELGIDFGISEKRIFFLETNARINNGTRLFYYLSALGCDPLNSSYIYTRNSILNFVDDQIFEFKNSPDVEFHIHPEDKMLIISNDPATISGIYAAIDDLARVNPPFPG